MDHGPNAPLPSWRRVLLAPVVGLVLVAGCESAGRRDPNDVLLGGTPPAPGPIPAPGKPFNGTASAQADTKPLPPLPPPGPSSSLASLAPGNNAASENNGARPPVVTPVPDGGWHGGANRAAGAA